MDLKSTVEQKQHVSIAPKTAAGKPATIDGLPTWEITEGGATLEVDPDGLGAFVISEDVEGSSQWKVSADADLGEGVRTLEVGGTYTYGPAEANDLGVTADAPVSK